MGNIYANGLVCIVAASGCSAEAGLPGISVPRKRQIQVPIYECGISLVSSLKPDPASYSYVDGSIWSTRGWTFQEYLLSKRIIFFIDGQIMWYCRYTEKTEDTDSELIPKNTHWHISIGSPTTLSDHAVQHPRLSLPYLWSQAAETYASKDFTFPGDAYDGITGVISFFEKHGMEFLWGMPRKAFDVQLLWSCHSGHGRRQCRTTLPMASTGTQVPFPSWTWLGWEPGKIAFRGASK
ncbi:hypothetical protein JX266_001120 [Neoarthrinium moseri]|nr:hypothetical protein JX266_001120 [Neoarthrinium moseri]